MRIGGSTMARHASIVEPCRIAQRRDASVAPPVSQEPPPMPIPAVMQGRLSLPAIGAPMFIVSVPALVIAQCTAGIVGCFPALNARPPEMLETWIVEIKTALAAFEAATGRK